MACFCVCVWRTAGQLACSAAVFRVCASPATGGALIATSGSAARILGLGVRSSLAHWAASQASFGSFA